MRNSLELAATAPNSFAVACSGTVRSLCALLASLMVSCSSSSLDSASSSSPSSSTNSLDGDALRNALRRRMSTSFYRRYQSRQSFTVIYRRDYFHSKLAFPLLLRPDLEARLLSCWCLSDSRAGELNSIGDKALLRPGVVSRLTGLSRAIVVSWWQNKPGKRWRSLHLTRRAKRVAVEDVVLWIMLA